MKQRTKVLDYAVIILATVLGAGSVLLFAAGASIVFVNLGWSEPSRLLWDAALSFAFFLQHSGMVRKSFHERLSRWIPDRYQGAVYAIASGIVLALVALLWQRSDTVLLHLQGVAFWIVLACAGVAAGFSLWAALALRPFDPLGITPLKAYLRGKAIPSSPFTVRGPYRWVRHPIYFGIIVLFWATPVLTADRLLLNLLWTGWIIVGSVLEERDLTARFGDAYRGYQRKVPMLIPWHRPVSPGS